MPPGLWKMLVTLFTLTQKLKKSLRGGENLEKFPMLGGALDGWVPCERKGSKAVSRNSLKERVFWKEGGAGEQFPKLGRGEDTVLDGKRGLDRRLTC